MRVLVTGANGWIGRHCVPILKEKGFEVVKYEGDLLTHFGTLPEASYLLHLAWVTTPGLYWESSFNGKWFEASIKLFQGFPGKRIVGAGTCAEITSTLYGRSKNALRKVLEAYSDITGLSSGWGRIFYLYGPYEKPERLVSSTIISLLKGEKVVIGKPNHMADFYHVHDVAGALCALLNSDVSGTVEIGSGSPVTLKRVVQMIASEIGREELVEYRDIPDPTYIKCDTERLRKEVKYKPKYDLKEGLKETIDWWRYSSVQYLTIR